MESWRTSREIIEERVAVMRCPKMGEKPVVRYRNSQWEVVTCCSSFTTAVLRMIDDVVADQPASAGAHGSNDPVVYQFVGGPNDGETTEVRVAMLGPPTLGLDGVPGYYSFDPFTCSYRWIESRGRNPS
jgi:hypothetical protein